MRNRWNPSFRIIPPVLLHTFIRPSCFSSLYSFDQVTHRNILAYLVVSHLGCCPLHTATASIAEQVRRRPAVCGDQTKARGGGTAQRKWESGAAARTEANSGMHHFKGRDKCCKQSSRHKSAKSQVVRKLVSSRSRSQGKRMGSLRARAREAEVGVRLCNWGQET